MLSYPIMSRFETSPPVMISFANQAERCCPFQLCIALRHRRTAEEEATGCPLETSTAYHQYAAQISSKPFQDLPVLHLTGYTYLGLNLNDQVVVTVRMAYLTADLEQILLVGEVEVLQAEISVAAEVQSMVMISGYQMHYERLAWRLSSGFPEMELTGQEKLEEVVVLIVKGVLKGPNLTWVDVPMDVMDWSTLAEAEVEEVQAVATLMMLSLSLLEEEAEAEEEACSPAPTQKMMVSEQALVEVSSGLLPTDSRNGEMTRQIEDLDEGHSAWELTGLNQQAELGVSVLSPAVVLELKIDSIQGQNCMRSHHLPLYRHHHLSS
jgi:hypothetical protein